jgi:predicted small metal-binding protein
MFFSGKARGKRKIFQPGNEARLRDAPIFLREKGNFMAFKEYKQISCRDFGADCDFLVRAESEDEVSALATEHACRVHSKCQAPSG